jgi:hypothetical protein
MKNKLLIILAISIFSTCASINVQARSFRGAEIILSPRALPQKGDASPRPADAALAGQLPAFDAGLVKNAVADLAQSWNSGKLSNYLDEGFYNKDRLLDTISSDIPKDAILRVLSIRNITVLNSSSSIDPNTQKVERASRVSATVETQVEFNHPANGFQRLPGTLELTLQVVESFD